MKTVKLLEVTPLAFGCELRKQEEESPTFIFEAMGEGAEDIAAEIQEVIDTAPPTMVMTVGYNASGHYIGNEEMSRYLCEERGIAPEVANPLDRVCSVGFCEKDQKWYGWSHRAIYGFGLGSVTKRGDCAYKAPTEEAFGQQMLDFFCGDDDSYINAIHGPSVDADGSRGVMVEATYSDKVPNERLRGTRYSLFRPYPETFGRGEWVAETMDDAKQMAIDFAESVS